MPDESVVGSGFIDIDTVLQVLDTDGGLTIGEDAIDRMQECRAFLEKTVSQNARSIYGVNTGFGSQYNVRISPDEIVRLQENLILSHAAGAGKAVDPEISRTMMLLKIISLCKGQSAVRPALVDRLTDYFNTNLIPVIYEFGSLGASGDLAPLAHMSLTLLGKGAFYSQDGHAPADGVLHQLDIEPLQLQAKEGLALINGTQFSCAHALLAWRDAIKLLRLSNLAAALSLEAFDCNMTPFDERIQVARGHLGQEIVASDILQMLDGSLLAFEGDKQLQDPYSFRCIPQVHGATFDVLAHARDVIETEINAVTDNPLVFHESNAILSGGNFHAQPLALLMDYIAMSVSELGSISERRTYKLLSGLRGLPDCLVTDAGLKSGLMIAQYTAASIVNRNKILCTPASIDSIPSSKGQEDHVSMAANAGTKLREVVGNCTTVVAIEFMSAMQAIDVRGVSEKLSPLLREIHTSYRKYVPYIEEDTIIHDLLERTELYMSHLDFSE